VLDWGFVLVVELMDMLLFFICIGFICCVVVLMVDLAAILVEEVKMCNCV